MPLFDFECASCGATDERLVKNVEPSNQFSFEPVERCQKCGSSDFRRLIGSPSFHLKGGGWAKDNYSGVETSKEKAT